MKRTIIDLLRHGETELGQVICGSSDPILSDLGQHQMAHQIHLLESTGTRWDCCFHSPRRRCSSVAKSLAKRLSIACESAEELREVDFGKWEGLSFEAVQQQYPGEWERWFTAGDGAPPHGGESNGAFRERVLAGWDELLTKASGQQALVVTHGGVIRMILAESLGMGSEAMFRLSVPFACHSRLIIYESSEHGRWLQLETHNSGHGATASPGPPANPSANSLQQENRNS